MRKDRRVVDIPLMDQLIVRKMNSTARARTVPVGRDAEYYLRGGKAVLRPKASTFKKGKPEQTRALAACAAEAKGRKFDSPQDLYEFMDRCMAEKGYE